MTPNDSHLLTVSGQLKAAGARRKRPARRDTTRGTGDGIAEGVSFLVLAVSL